MSLNVSSGTFCVKETVLTTAVLLKAIMLHTPIVSTDTYRMRTIVPDDTCGYLLPMGDTEGLKSKVTTLLTDEKLRKYVADAALANFEKFTPESVGRRIVEVISSIA